MTNNNRTSVNDIRESFLSFFETKQHSRQHSSPLVPHNDPTLMFVNAGMVPFKNVFTGAEKRDYNRATSSQKCVRAGGKHNDLDNVGYTARHHTFFEMLGNFSFGDYFKEDAIKYAWEFLTSPEWLGLDKDKLSITVYHTDDEAFNIWKEITNFPDEKILRIPTNDNFWSMGDTGPCGPCSEIFYDHGSNVEGEWRIDENGNDLFEDRFIEIWNLVFMQYEQLESGERINLPKPSIDTGMGLERIAAVKQGVHDNYDIDLFKNVISDIKNLTGGDNNPLGNKALTAYKVIADHLRSTSFLLADGVMPSNEGRGYVLRRIMRRAMRYAYNLGCQEPLMYKLVPSLVKEMGTAYPELQRAEKLITEMLKLEEERFRETLGRGLKLLASETESLSSGDKLAGDIAFKLYDTYGFPLDLTIDILRGENIEVDEAGFEVAMQEQKDRAKAAWKGSGAKATDEIWFDIKENNGATEFLGYELIEAEASITHIINKDGKPVEEASTGDEVSIILNQTPFYAESGGQEGDQGIIFIGSDNIAKITATDKQLGALHIHRAIIEKGGFKADQQVNTKVDDIRRDKLRANHSATHLLHAVLRNILGDHVTQKGSLVAEDKLRFDISHPKALTPEEISQIENEVNSLIRANTTVGTKLMSPDDAIEQGAMALFGEKYGDEVRVVDMGQGANQSYSVELCGGTHVKRTGDIGLFKIVTEGAIAAGVRRIEALTGQEAMSYFSELENNVNNLASTLKVTPDELQNRIDAIISERKKLEKDLSEARKSLAMGGSSDIKPEDINGISFIGKHFTGIPPKDLRSVVEDLKKNIDTGIVAVASNFDGKASIIVAVTDNITDKYNAPELVRIGSAVAGGKGGGGKPNFAQAGGSEGGKVEEVISSIKDKLAG